MEYTLPQLLKALIDMGGSDLHISSGSAPRFRIHGSLQPLDVGPMNPEQTKSLIYAILTSDQKSKFERLKEIDFAFSVKNLARFRANVYMQKGFVSGAFRVIPFQIKTLEELGLPQVVHQLCKLPRGLILVTGPTGSGKSTTLSAMINHINVTETNHIVTIEDPIEFVHEHKNCLINQREIGPDTLGFENALRSALRQDPDVVLVGEMRDLETIRLAISTAETGHLVFGTLHTNSAVTSLNRMIDVFPADQQAQIRSQLSLNLQAVISQILLPSTQGGRVMAMEIMIPDIAIRNLMRENKLHQVYSSMQAGQANSGMQTMNQSLFNLLKRRLITQDLAFAKSPDADELAEMIDKFKAQTQRMANNRPKAG